MHGDMGSLPGLPRHAGWCAEGQLRPFHGHGAAGPGGGWCTAPSSAHGNSAQGPGKALARADNVKVSWSLMKYPFLGFLWILNKDTYYTHIINILFTSFSHPNASKGSESSLLTGGGNPTLNRWQSAGLHPVVGAQRGRPILPLLAQAGRGAAEGSGSGLRLSMGIA